MVRLGPRDAGEVMTLQRAAYVLQARAHNDWDLPPLLQSLPDVEAELADPQVMALGSRDERGRLVATVRARHAEPTSAVADIARLAVVPDRQGHGLGSALLAALEARLPESVVEFRLFTGEHAVDNLRLYARLGYTETRREPTSSGYCIVHLSKQRMVARSAEAL